MNYTASRAFRSEGAETVKLTAEPPFPHLTRTSKIGIQDCTACSSSLDAHTRNSLWSQKGTPLRLRAERSLDWHQSATQIFRKSMGPMTHLYSEDQLPAFYVFNGL